eukprot:gene1987-2309_t
MDRSGCRGRLLETERDEAVKTAESCARTAVKLEEMTRLFENLAVDKLTEGDEEGARQVLKAADPAADSLQEKVAVMEVLSRTGNRAQVNYSLAAKLAEKIGQQQLELMNLLAPTTPTNSSGAAPQPAAASAVASAVVQRTERQPGGNLFAQYDATKSSAERLGSDRAGVGGSTSKWSSDSAAVGSSGYYEAPWEKSIAEAKDRIRKAEEEAAAAGRRAAWQQQESVEEARERLRSSAWASVDAARSRIRQSAQESIEQARARIAAEDAAVLAQVHALINRYRSGAYVSEDELDWAFRQLEKRSWRQ